MTIHKVLRISEPSTVSVVRGVVELECVFAVGDEFATVDEVLTKLNASFGAWIEFTIDADGYVSIALTSGTEYDLTWGAGQEARDYLGYTGDLDELTPDATNQVAGWWTGNAIMPFGLFATDRYRDVANWHGRLNTDGDHGRRTGTITLWANTSQVDADFETNMARIYALCLEWAGCMFTLVDSYAGTVTPCYATEGWVPSPYLMDEYRVSLDVEVTQCLV